MHDDFHVLCESTKNTKEEFTQAMFLSLRHNIESTL